MPVHPTQRKRYPSEAVAVGGLVGIINGIFGVGSPASQLSSPAEVVAPRGFFHLHEGDLFQPGTGNWVLDPTHEAPLQTNWGHAFLRTPNTFNPFQAPQVYANPGVITRGIGGQIAGQFVTQPLSESNPG